MVNRRELLEQAKVFGHYYGTPRAPVEAALAAGRDVLFDIDWQGTQQLAEKRARGSGQRLHPAALDPRAGAPAADPRPGQRRGGRPAHGQGGRRDEPLGRIRLHHRQSRSGAQPRARCRRSCRPSACAASARSACMNSSRGCAKASSAAQRFGQSRELGDGQLLGPPGLGDAGRGQQGGGIAAQRAQALAQHLAPLTEGGRRDALQRAGSAGASGGGARHQLARRSRSPWAAG